MECAHLKSIAFDELVKQFDAKRKGAQGFTCELCPKSAPAAFLCLSVA